MNFLNFLVIWKLLKLWGDQIYWGNLVFLEMFIRMFSIKFHWSYQYLIQSIYQHGPILIDIISMIRSVMITCRVRYLYVTHTFSCKWRSPNLFFDEFCILFYFYILSLGRSYLCLRSRNRGSTFHTVWFQWFHPNLDDQTGQMLFSVLIYSPYSQIVLV